MFVVERYPSLARTMKPELLPAYEICAWLVSSDVRSRRMGRTTVLAAAFLREAILGRSARIWDHSAAPNQVEFVRDKIRGLADDIGLTVKFDGQNILRKVEAKDSARNPATAIAGDNGVVLLETLRRTVQNLLAEGVSPEAVAAAAKKMAYETVVEEVHAL